MSRHTWLRGLIVLVVLFAAAGAPVEISISMENEITPRTIFVPLALIGSNLVLLAAALRLRRLRAR